MQANLNKVWVVGLFITFGHFSLIFFFQCISQGVTPDVQIPVSQTIPENQAKVEKPLKSEAAERQQTRINKYKP